MHAPATLTTTPAVPRRWLHASPEHRILPLSSSAGHVHMTRQEGLWFVYHVHPRKGRLVIGQTSDHDLAQRVAESYVLASSREKSLTESDATWREQPMSPGQRRRLAALLGAEPDVTLTAGQASDIFQTITAQRALHAAEQSRS